METVAVSRRAALTFSFIRSTEAKRIMDARLYSFIGGVTGDWQIVRMDAIAGDALPAVSRLAVTSGSVDSTRAGAAWCLRGITSNERYVTAQEKEQLQAKQEGLGRPESTCVALIPIRKNAEWWSLPQDARRRIFEERSHHIEIGLKYLPAVARRLYHCRDLSGQEPFDFLTWFEYAPSDVNAFDDLVAKLRASEEWRYVEREVDIRLTRGQP
jgi:chlorite dismutase